MKLHRVGKRADWDKLKGRQRNFWQRLAVRTHGLITPGNIISIIGFIFVGGGLFFILRGPMAAGLVAIVIGRILDIVDGLLADKTGTKSPLGETIDATIDKIEIAAALPVIVIAGILMPWQAALIFLQHLANVVFTGLAKIRHRAAHASRAGKYATTAQWAAIALYGTAGLRSSLSGITILADAVFGASVALGTVAAFKYASKALNSLDGR